ncbi:ABC transporter ATP-binding protein [Rubrobacter indicoceani]|uniref:ABC transporter ATP-binding protein n=1 Tax=Rubrobacter indicoceani TaxID=2051957 RepID=UPI000E5B80C6|nr:ABC transporter ATP-binding protein [Rubrobacter indicoceani]
MNILGAMAKFPLVRLFTFAGPYRFRLLGLGLVTTVVTALTISEALLVRYAIDGGLSAGDLNVVYLAAGLYVAVAVSVWVLSYVETIGMGWIGQHMVLDLRKYLFDHLQALSLQYYSEQKAGWIISRLTNDIENFNTLLNDGVQNLVRNGLTLLGVVGVLFYLDWRLALATMAVLPVMIVATIIYRHESMKAFRRAREAVAELAAYLQEHVSGMRVVQAFTREKQSVVSFDRRNMTYRRANQRSTTLSAVYFPGVEFLGAIGLSVVILYGGYLVVGGTTTIGTLVAFVGLISMAFQPIQALSQLYSDLQSTIASLEKVFSILDTTTDRADVPNAKVLDSITGEVEFDGVGFGYGDGPDILSGVGFRIEAGETLAIVGETGAGKSTIVKLLSRFYDPTSGTIRVDGEDLKNVRGSSLRSHMGVVLQDTFLFTGTIEENILYGRPDASREEVVAAAEAVGADDFIRRFPNGYKTEVGERGGGLSVGERQLISFARALIADPSILVLDEATSSVDLATEAKIEVALERLLEGRTSIVIAHRLSTVRRADRILYLADGKVLEQGSHDELLSRPSAYRRLYEAQFAA